MGHHLHPHLEQVVLGLEPSKYFLFVIYSFAFELSKNAEAVLKSLRSDVVLQCIMLFCYRIISNVIRIWKQLLHANYAVFCDRQRLSVLQEFKVNHFVRVLLLLGLFLTTESLSCS